MKHLSFLLTALLFAACSNQTPPVSSDLDLSEFTISEINGISVAEKTNDDLQTIEKGFLKNGMKNGSWMSYYPDKGIIKTHSSFLDNKLNGPYLEFSNRGQIEKEIEYFNNTYHGKFATYKNGRALKEMQYNMGVLEGPLKEYDTRGNLQKETEFQDGKPHGMMRFYDEGKLVMEYKYNKGEKVSGGIVESEDSEE